MIKCNKCHTEKPDSGFYKIKGTERRLLHCNDCKRRIHLEWARRNKDKKKAYARADYEKVKNRNCSPQIDGVKTCLTCGIEKSRSLFVRCKMKVDGLSSICKSCKSDKDKEYRLANKEKVSEIQKEYRVKNREKMIEYSRKYWSENRDSLISRQKEYYKKNKDRLYRNSRKWISENLERYKEYQRKWISDNIDKVRESSRENIKRRLSTDPGFRLITYVRKRTRNAVKGYYKNKPSIEYLGCSSEFLMNHLQSQFKDGMSWDNYGINGWHIDHKIPLTWFDLSKEEERYKAFGWQNLQPLWAEENLKKGNRRADV